MEHNLNIHNYSLEERLQVFELSFNITLHDLKRAKKQVLMLHPDKSKLSSDYFLFYKKAYEIIVEFFENNNKQNQSMDDDSTTYHSETLNNFNDKHIHDKINDMAKESFQSKFNQLFEANMEAKQNRNEWFSQTAPTHEYNEPVNSKNMGKVFESMKSNTVTQYRGVKELEQTIGSNFYDDDEGEYVYCDPFSKLKFDDLRKVHKDKTIFDVSEQDFKDKNLSVEHLTQIRRQPINIGSNHEQLLANKQQETKERMMKKDYHAKLQTMDYEKRNKSILSSFLHLEN